MTLTLETGHHARAEDHSHAPAEKSAVPTILALIAVFVAAVAAAVSVWGVVALSMTALVMVPVTMIVLVMITLG